MFDLSPFADCLCLQGNACAQEGAAGEGETDNFRNVWGPNTYSPPADHENGMEAFNCDPNGEAMIRVGKQGIAALTPRTGTYPSPLHRAHWNCSHGMFQNGGGQAR